MTAGFQSSQKGPVSKVQSNRHNTRVYLLGACLLLAAGLLGVSGCGGGATASPDSSRGAVVSYQLAAAYSRLQVQLALQELGLTISAPGYSGVRLYRVVYWTIDVQGNPTTASGMIAYPQGVSGPRPLLSYQHGTQVEKAEVPSNPGNEEMLAVSLGLTSAGYVVAAADYLGLGESEGIHPYVHAESEASACLDMLRAALAVSDERNVQLSDKLFLAGYSQGGHATMALHRTLEETAGGEFMVTAATPMAGPYDLSDTTFGMALTDPSESSSLYAAYLLVAYDAIYDVYSSPAEAFVAPLDGIVESLFDGYHSTSAIMAALPATPQDMLRPEYIEAVATNPDHPLNVALRDNDLYDWRPIAPVRLFHGGADKTVPFENSMIAYEHMSALGADIELINVGAGLDHGTAVMPCFLGAKERLDSFLD